MKKIAAISICFNEEFRLDKWLEYYNQYKNELYKHIIIDNASSNKFVDLIKVGFPESIIVERNTNGGCTGAYNDGIRIALSDPDVDAILLIGNDIQMPSGNLSILCDYLFSDDKLGMVSPVILQKDSNLIESYGATYTKFNRMHVNYRGVNLDHISINEQYVDIVPGGMNLAKRNFYEKVGLQDENLFMYCDEPDMYRRSKQQGIKIGATKRSITWHQHINPGFKSTRSIKAAFFTGRNYIYLAKKHDGLLKAIMLFFYYNFRTLLIMLRDASSQDSIRFNCYIIKGLWYGLIGKMDNSIILK